VARGGFASGNKFAVMLRKGCDDIQITGLVNLPRYE
jgi:hypothetical protein